ncbi:Hyaluronidase-1 [Holothuria leucospilota]|uniref:Hyaluronidase n=1 Tax=Holothuria leucospilota TaxID=206669 RepID=A0A9Q1BDF9_HOLLE|nr:Hyaluronidase-1 [Holothuria leucospilota]
MAEFIESLLCVSLFCIVGINSAILSENALPEIYRDSNPERSSKDTKNPYVWKDPFVAYWNVPSYDCPHVFNVDLYLDKFGITANTGQNFTGDKIVIFYQDELGYYPYFNHTLQPVNGGLPQVGNISVHLEKATEDILKAIPDPQFKGVGILDWESWRPQWEQNFDTRQIYRKKSIELVYNKHPEWSNETIELVATAEFEQAADNWMKSTLRLAKDLRPNARWGFYHFPYCYNNKDPAYCTQEAVLTNDNITWLFDSSTALYPSIYVGESLERKDDFVHAIVAEAFRLRNKSRNPFVDVYPYTRYVYARSEVFLTKVGVL